MLRNIFKGQMPDITPAQIIGGTPVLAEFLHTFGIYSLSSPQQESLTKAVIWGIALILGDTGLRIGRNIRAGREGARLQDVEFDPSEAEEEARAALRDQLGREPSDEEVVALLDRGLAPPREGSVS